MNSKNLREKFQNIFRSSVFIYIIHKISNGIHKTELVKVEFFINKKGFACSFVSAKYINRKVKESVTRVAPRDKTVS